MADRKLRHGEKMLSGAFTSERGRDRANARRTIEGLSQNDQMIELLYRISGSMDRLTAQMQWVTEEMARKRRVDPPTSVLQSSHPEAPEAPADDY